jgi:hypothetical protein
VNSLMEFEFVCYSLPQAVPDQTAFLNTDSPLKEVEHTDVSNIPLH